MSSNLFKDEITYKLFTLMYLIYMYKQDLSLNNLQWLIYSKTQPNQINCFFFFSFERDCFLFL